MNEESIIYRYDINNEIMPYLVKCNNCGTEVNAEPFSNIRTINGLICKYYPEGLIVGFFPILPIVDALSDCCKNPDYEYATLCKQEENINKISPYELKISKYLDKY